MNLRYNLILLVIFLLVQSAAAQDTGNSPYSAIGLGDISYKGNIRNIGMGNTGVASPHSEFINIINPALLPVNKTSNRDSTLKFTMLEAGFVGDRRMLTTSTTSQTNGGFNINYINIAFPFSQNWTSSVGLRPFSTVQNTYNARKVVNSLEYITSNSFNGGINQVHFSNGYDISKKFSIGLFAGYIFGNIREERVVQPFTGKEFLTRTGVEVKNLYNGFEFKPGIAYRTQLLDSSGTGKGTFLNIGATYSTFAGVKGRSYTNSIRVSSLDDVAIYDSSMSLVQTLNATFPSSLSAGISIDRPDRFSLALDFTQTNWQNFNSLQNPEPIELRNSYTLSLGGEVKPGKNISLTSPEYRFGISYSKLPITLMGEQLDDLSFSVGTSVPLGKKDARYKSKPLTKINVALVYGNRGTTNNGLVKEQYFKFFIGAIIQDKWFQRWKID